MSDTPASTSFVIERTFAASVARVWAAWTRPTAINAWMGPPGPPVRVLSFDLRPGGGLQSVTDMPDGSVLGTRFVYRTVEAPHRLVWEHGFGNAEGEVVRAPFSATWPLRLLTTVLLTPGGHEATQVSLTWTPIDAPPEDLATFQAARPGMTAGWTGSFDRLAAHLASS